MGLYSKHPNKCTLKKPGYPFREIPIAIPEKIKDVTEKGIAQNGVIKVFD